MNWKAKIIFCIAGEVYTHWNEGVLAEDMLRYIVWQKVLGFNRHVPYPVHFTSVVSHPDNIFIENLQATPGYAPHCYITAQNKIYFGQNVVVAPSVGIVSANHNPNDYRYFQPASPIRIGSNVWIARGANILPESKIGNNVIIGAGSVVKGEIPDNSVVAGNPARVVAEKPPYTGNPIRWVISRRKQCINSSI